MSYDVFISFKHTDCGRITQDTAMANELYQRLKAKGISVFFSEQTLPQLGESVFKKKIDEALDSANVFVLVCTNANYPRTGWINYECETFLNEILSGNKPSGQMITFIKDISIKDLPLSLHRFQSFNPQHGGYEPIVSFIKTIVDNQVGVEPAGSKIVYVKSIGDIIDPNPIVDDAIVSVLKESNEIVQQIEFKNNYTAEVYRTESNLVTLLLQVIKKGAAFSYYFDQYVRTLAEESVGGSGISGKHADAKLVACHRLIKLLVSSDDEFDSSDKVKVIAHHKHRESLSLEFTITEDEHREIRVRNRQFDIDYLQDLSANSLMENALISLIKHNASQGVDSVTDKEIWYPGGYTLEYRLNE